MKAEQIVSWLLSQCDNPTHYAHRPTILATAKVVGQRFKRVLLEFRHQIVRLSDDPAIKDSVIPILDYLEDRR